MTIMLIIIIIIITVDVCAQIYSGLDVWISKQFGQIWSDFFVFVHELEHIFVTPQKLHRNPCTHL